MAEPDLRTPCSAASNCPAIALNPDGTVTVWSTERSDERATFDAGEWSTLLDMLLPAHREQIAEELRAVARDQCGWLWFEVGEGALERVANHLAATGPQAGPGASVEPDPAADALTYDELESERDRLARELYEAQAAAANLTLVGWSTPDGFIAWKATEARPLPEFSRRVFAEKMPVERVERVDG